MRFLLFVLLLGCSGYQLEPSVFSSYAEGDSNAAFSHADNEAWLAGVQFTLVPPTKMHSSDMDRLERALRDEPPPPLLQAPDSEEDGVAEDLIEHVESFDAMDWLTRLLLFLTVCWLGWVYRVPLARLIPGRKGPSEPR
jgi:hypothetical protein